MATDADANKAIIIVRNITHLRDLAFEVSTPFGVGFSQIPKATLGRTRGGGGAILLTSARLYLEDQQPRKMLLILRSTSLFSSLIAASPLLCGAVISADLPEPVVTPLPVLTGPDDCAVPEVLVPGAGGDASLEAFAAPLGSSPALFNPPGAAGPGGMPLVPCESAPAEPALGEPAALPPLLPADEPPALWPNDATGDIRIVIAATAAAADASFIENLLSGATTTPQPLFLPERFRCQIIHSHPLDARSDRACAN
jgi:hypothetical protein